MNYLCKSTICEILEQWTLSYRTVPNQYQSKLIIKNWLNHFFYFFVVFLVWCCFSYGNFSSFSSLIEISLTFHGSNSKLSYVCVCVYMYFVSSFFFAGELCTMRSVMFWCWPYANHTREFSFTFYTLDLRSVYSNLLNLLHLPLMHDFSQNLLLIAFAHNTIWTIHKISCERERDFFFPWLRFNDFSTY